MTQERDFWLQEARRALEQQRWRELVRIVQRLQQIDPQAAEPFVEALWEHIHQTRGDRQSRLEQARDLYQAAREGHWDTVWETLQALDAEDPSGARHMARLLFVHPSYFSETQPREQVRRPSFWATLARPREVALYLYGYGPGTLEDRWAWQVLALQAAGLVLAALTWPSAPAAAWPGLLLGILLWALSGWGMRRYRATVSTSQLRALGLAVVSALVVGVSWPWGMTVVGAILPLVLALGLLAGWQEAHLGPGSALWTWGAVIGVLVRGILQPSGSVPVPLWVLWILAIAALARWLVQRARPRWIQRQPTLWYIQLVWMALLALVAVAAWRWLQVLPG